MPKEIRQGERLDFQAMLKTNSGECGDHVLSLTLRSPDGTACDLLQGNCLALGGKLKTGFKRPFE